MKKKRLYMAHWTAMVYVQGKVVIEKSLFIKKVFWVIGFKGSNKII